MVVGAILQIVPDLIIGRNTCGVLCSARNWCKTGSSQGPTMQAVSGMMDTFSRLWNGAASEQVDNRPIHNESMMQQARAELKTRGKVLLATAVALNGWNLIPLVGGGYPSSLGAFGSVALMTLVWDALQVMENFEGELRAQAAPADVNGRLDLLKRGTVIFSWVPSPLLARGAEHLKLA